LSAAHAVGLPGRAARLLAALNGRRCLWPTRCRDPWDTDSMVAGRIFAMRLASASSRYRVEKGNDKNNSRVSKRI